MSPDTGKLVLLVHDLKTANVVQVKSLALPELKTSIISPAPATSLDGLFPIAMDSATAAHCVGGVCALPVSEVETAAIKEKVAADPAQ